jgi:phosphoribosylformylglycinamidine synthase
MWQFARAVEGIGDACRRLDTPIVSGNVSLYNETDGRAIQPTPTIGMVGLMDDARKAVTSWFKDEGDLIVLVGETREEIGASEYLAQIHGREEGAPPGLDLALESAVQDMVLKSIDKGIVRSAHDCSEGGLAVALAECCMGGTDALGAGAPLAGATVDLPAGVRVDALLFGETASRVLLTVKEVDLPVFEALVRAGRAPVRVIGRVTGGAAPALEIRSGGGRLLHRPVDALHRLWHCTFPSLMKG